MSVYAGKKVLVVGGSQGIGRSIALSLAQQQAHVVVAARRQDPLDQVVAAMKQLGNPSQILGSVSMDVTDPAQVQRGIDQALGLLGGCDYQLCISGMAYAVPLSNLPLDVFEQMMRVNFWGHVHVTRALLPHFKQQRSGHIALASSMLGFMSMYGWSGYSASKFAVHGFAQALRQEMLQDNVGVSVHFFPSTQTPGFDLENETKDPIVHKMETENGFSKVYSPDQVAASCLAGIAKGRFENVVGWDSWLIHTANKHLPRLVRWFTDRDLRQAQRKQ